MPSRRRTSVASSGSASGVSRPRISLRSLSATLRRKATSQATSIIPTMREQLTVRLQRFYTIHDPRQLAEGVDSAVDYALANGLDALNSQLLAHYGDTLEGSLTSFVGASYDNLTGSGDATDRVRARLELFFAKYEPQKLESKVDIFAVVEWALFYGVTALNERLQKRYGATLDDVALEDICNILQAFYDVNDATKSKQDIMALAKWAFAAGAHSLNERMIERYGRGLVSARERLKQVYYTRLFEQFYRLHDPTKMTNGDIELIVEWTLLHGIDQVNEKLRKKYGGKDLAPFEEQYQNRFGVSAFRGHAPAIAGQSSNSFATSITDASGTNPSAAPAASSADDGQSPEDRDRLTMLLHVFYSKHDATRLLDEGLSAIVDWVQHNGRAQLNARMQEKYQQDLDGLEAEYDALVAKLEHFLAHYDPAMLEASKASPQGAIAAPNSLHGLAKWAVVNGETALSDKLLARYDDDLVGRGLTLRLLNFFKVVEPSKPVEDVEEMVRWALSNSIELLNQNLKAEYGRNLNDPLKPKERKQSVKQNKFFFNRKSAIGRKAMNKKNTPRQSKRKPGAKSATGSRSKKKSPSSEEHSSKPGKPANLGNKEGKRADSGSANESHMLSRNDSDINNNNNNNKSINGGDGVDQLPVATFVSNDIAHQVDELSERVELFFHKHDPRELGHPDAVAEKVQWIMENGIEAFNRALVGEYGESLNSFHPLSGRARAPSNHQHHQSSKPHKPPSMPLF